MIYYYSYTSPLGDMIMTSDGTALTGLWFDRESRPLSGESSCCSLPVFDQTYRWLNDYFAGHPPQETPLLAPEGTPFRQQVWQELCRIPYGETTTYGALAQTLARLQGREHMSARAVGGAVGSNPISIVVPCHRVMGAGGRLTGYGGGVRRKVWLLRHEGVDTESFVIPRLTTGPTAW